MKTEGKYVLSRSIQYRTYKGCSRSSETFLSDFSSETFQNFWNTLYVEKFIKYIVCDK